MTTPKIATLASALALCAVLAACGGGGSSPSGGGGSVVPPAPTPTATVTPTDTISGTAVEYVSSTPLSGFTVTVGQVPTTSTCLASQTASANACGVPAGTTVTTTTSSTGTFSLTVPATGTYMLTIGKDTTYATLHRTVAVVAGANALGTVKVAALSTDEQNWLVDVNNQRATVSVPTSFADLQVDEYAEEQARLWAANVAAGTTTYGDAGYAAYQTAYGSNAGSLYSAAGVLVEYEASSAYLQADTEWMAEKANCPSGNWQSCPTPSDSSGETGHYVNVSNTNTVWVGLGESNTSFVLPGFGNEWAYNLMLVENAGSAGPASKMRLPVAF